MDRGVEVGAEALKVGEDIRRLQYPGRAFILSDEGQSLYHLNSRGPHIAVVRRDMARRKSEKRVGLYSIKQIWSRTQGNLCH
jgi:hypothetical protein